MKSHSTSQSFLALMTPNSPWKKSAEERAAMTIACKDADYIPRVNGAGTTKLVDGKKVQVMHNGLLVEENGYQGGWQAKTIQSLRGVHEPQEEKVFYEVLKRIDKPSAMIELGAWWAYYSMWYLKTFPEAKVVCTEPDPVNIELGKRNMKLNNFEEERATFVAAASGKTSRKKLKFTTEDGRNLSVPIISVDEVIRENKLSKVDILHMDIQGAELDALKSAEAPFADGKIRFVFVSTHHYSISENPVIHQDCLDFIEKNGGHIIASHTVLESCSGDGLIVASFDKKDRDFTVDIFRQSTQDSLFRPYEEDIEILSEAYDKKTQELEALREEMANRIEELSNLNRKKDELLGEITPLRRHIKRQVKQHLGANEHKKTK